MKKSIVLATLFLISLLFSTVVFAESTTSINISDNEITINGENITTDITKPVYLTNKMDNGGIETESKDCNIEIDSIININAAGTYEFSGELENGQISVNANSIKGNVNIILNNLSIKCKSAPAIFVYSKDIENENCKVTITSKENTVNNVTGGKIKQSVEGWKDQNNIVYYVEKGYNDDRQYYERYKYDGAISSDVSLTFEGEGILNVTAAKKEGIESKMHITINSGIYNINSLDDGINACSDNKSKIIINGGTVIVKVLDDAEEGDGIDSNGSITINGGSVYTLAHPGSDNGLDADQGIYINGGTVLSTGDMAEEIKSSNNTNIVQMSFNKQIDEGETILILDENEKVVFAYKTDRKLSTFVYSSNKLIDVNYVVYTGTDVEGTIDDNNIYTNINSFDLNKMIKQENSGIGNRYSGFGEMNENFEKSDSILPNTTIGIGIFITLIIILFIVIGIFGYDIYKEKTYKIRK